MTRDLVDQQGSVYWLTTAANAVFQYPFPRFQQNFAVFGHLFQQCFEQRATDAAISICLLLEKHIVQYKGEEALELRFEFVVRMCSVFQSILCRYRYVALFAVPFKYS